MRGESKRVKTYSRSEVINQYARFAEAAEEYQKVDWGSAESMRNRFVLAITRLPLAEYSSLLDVGCGTGMFLEMLSSAYPQLHLTGVDICDRLVAFARQKHVSTGVTILSGSFLDVQGTFDCISCIGVLQKTDMSLDTFFAHARKNLTSNGQLWVDTKHNGWCKFTAGEVQPESTHAHFDLPSIRNSARKQGFAELESFGFLPGANQITDVAGSHTVIVRFICV